VSAKTKQYIAVAKSVLLISSGQPSLNPRLVKEADALTNAGYEVTVLYAYWNEWGTRHDKELLAGKKWQAICAGGDPKEKQLNWFLSRLIQKTASSLLKNTNCYSWFADLAIARSSYFLAVEARKYPADLYIGHNLGALPATVKTAKLHKKPCGFDAEDFHRQEVTDDIHSYPVKISKYIEDKYLPQVVYITASSPLIAENYSLLYQRNITAILNVFPKVNLHVADNKNKPLKLFWFSQTIGPNRGLELIIEAMGLAGINIELHLLGELNNDYKQNLFSLSKTIENVNTEIFFYEPIKAGEIFQFAAQFDIGLAAETIVCLNREISLTNKLFTYIQSGLAVAASDTVAQRTFIDQYPQTGKVYRNAKELASILIEYHKNRELLFQTKKESFGLGQTKLNWENESSAFMKVIDNILTAN
jgi:glycosyltransferase involved in cell wall biosynthesis